MGVGTKDGTHGGAVLGKQGEEICRHKGQAQQNSANEVVTAGIGPEQGSASGCRQSTRTVYPDLTVRVGISCA